MATQIILTAAGEVAMIVHDARNPGDKAWNPPDCVRVEIDRTEYDATGGDFEVAGANYLPLLKAVEARVRTTHAVVGQEVTDRIARIEADRESKIERERLAREQSRLSEEERVR